MPTIPNPLTSYPPLCCVPIPNSSPSHFSRQQSSALLFPFNFPSCTPILPHYHQPIIPLQPFSPSASFSAHSAPPLSHPALSAHSYILPSHLPFVILLFIPPSLIPLCTAWLLVVWGGTNRVWGKHCHSAWKAQSREPCKRQPELLGIRLANGSLTEHKQDKIDEKKKNITRENERRQLVSGDNKQRWIEHKWHTSGTFLCPSLSILQSSFLVSHFIRRTCHCMWHVHPKSQRLCACL